MQPTAERASAVFLPTFAVAGVVLGWLAAGDLGFRDAGEIGTAAYTLGVAHPTGFAVDLLVLRASALLPLGSIALRQNLSVALQGALSLALLAALGELLAGRLGVRDGALRRFAALLPALALGCWPTFLGTATVTEVYTLALLLVLLAAYGVARGGPARGLAACALGLAPGLHVTVGLYAGLLFAMSALSAGARGALAVLRVRLPVVLSCAAVVSYLPLASRRQPALDWGDPESLARVLDHLSAARIRSAYAAEMLAGGASATLRVVEQALELWPVIPFALLALALGMRSARPVVLAPLALVVADLAYAAWINPMGAIDRQVGHLAGAGLCLLGGLGLAAACSALRLRAQRAAGAVVLAGGVAAFALAAWPALGREPKDDYAANELHGSGGPLASVPPRAVIVCEGDDSCAGGLFAIHVEAVRPDVDVVPAQHLWDPTVRRRVEGLGIEVGGEPAAPERAAMAAGVLRRLAMRATARPVLFVASAALRRSGAGDGVKPYAGSEPYLAAGATELPARDGASIVEAVDRLRRARLGAAPPRADRAQLGWALAYDAIGTALLARDRPAALRALREATTLAPSRATGWTNLGVALEAAGQWAEALRCAQRAVELEPERPTPWVNLARLQLRIAGPAAAMQVIATARQAGVRDERLDALARALEASRRE